MTAVTPHGNCPHLKDHYSDVENMPKHWTVPLPCKSCSDTSENWICLTCWEINCSRFVNGHALAHYEKTGHAVVASFSDFSVWCYLCTSPDHQPGWYIKHQTLRPILQFLYQLKYPDEVESKPASTSHSGRSANDDITEYYDEPDVVAKKVSELAALIKNSKHIVAYTGAGVSTSAKIPDYRGPKGIWTLRDKGMSSFMDITLEQALPTPTHMSLVELKNKGILKFLVSTNVDGLHRRSGYSATEMSELHGNCYKEFCTNCKKEYLRNFDCASSSSDHITERKCDVCKTKLHDTIINFGESLPEEEVQKTILQAHKSDLSLVLGTSMRVRPACEFPLEALKNKGKMVIVNLQKTPYDGYAALIIREKTDKVMELLMKELGLAVPEYKLENDFTKMNLNSN